MPLVTPEIVAGISLLVLFAGLKIALGLTTIVIAHVAFSVSFVTVVVLARLAGMDRSLEEAALILGADEWTTFFRVTLPQLLPGVLSGALLAFTLSFDDYVITSFVAGSGTSTLPVVVYGMVRRNIDPTINAISTLVLVFTTLLIWLADRPAGSASPDDPSRPSAAARRSGAGDSRAATSCARPSPPGPACPAIASVLAACGGRGRAAAAMRHAGDAGQRRRRNSPSTTGPTTSVRPRSPTSSARPASG